MCNVYIYIYIHFFFYIAAGWWIFLEQVDFTACDLRSWRHDLRDPDALFETGINGGLLVGYKVNKSE